MKTAVFTRNLLALTILITIALALSCSALGQTVVVQAKPITDSDIQLLRQNIQAQKNQIINDNMTFTVTEAAAFWPIYKDYTAAQNAIADKRLALITDYARGSDKMDDAAASDLTQRMFGIEEETQALSRDYFPRFTKALGAKRAAKFYQVDNRLTLMINLQITGEIPLIP
jgi:hypothetical protein